MRFMNRFVRQHGLTHNVANGKDVWHVGAHLNVNRNETTVCHVHTRFFCSNLLAVGCATHSLQDHVVDLRRWGCNALLCRFKCHLNTGLGGFGPHGFGFEHDVVKTRGVHFLPDLDQIAVGSLHQPVHHFNHIKARAQRAVNGAHF